MYIQYELCYVVLKVFSNSRHYLLFIIYYFTILLFNALLSAYKYHIFNSQIIVIALQVVSNMQ